MIDSKQQRMNMVESQVRPSDVTDRRIIRAMLEVPREVFVPASLQALAYMDESVPAVEGQDTSAPRYLLAPRTFAKLVQLASVEPEAAVLDIGCATGYSTAVLARLAKMVVAVEADGALAAGAEQRLRQLGVSNAVVIAGPLEKGAPSHAPFDAIVLNGSVGRMPEEMLAQLKNGGRLVAVVANGAFGRVYVWQRTGNLLDQRPDFDAAAHALPGFFPQAEFTL
jgi:protein-L-isoaspartate(D-aspartate) O-methyltransferase